MGRKSVLAGVAVVVLTGLFAGQGSAFSQAQAGMHPATGVGSCTLKNWNANLDPGDAKDLPLGARPQTYKPDDYNCTGATFASNGVEFAQFPQPKTFHVNTQGTVQSAQAAATSNPLAPYFPPFTHFVILYRENHTFDDYLGDCATTIQAGCKGVVQSTNHISSVPNLHTLAKTYSLLDTYSTGTQPPSGPNHWWLFSAQSSSSSQQQSYPAATGTQFDRFLKGVTGPPGEGTDPCATQTGTATGSSPYTFVMNGDFYWMLNSGSGEWRNAGTGKPEVLPLNRPGTNIPEELTYNNYTCKGQNDPDQTIGTGFQNFVATNGLPAYSYVELFNDHPGTYQDIPTNDAVTKQVVDSIMNNAAYKDNTLIVVTEDDTQNGNNGPDHISNTYRVPAVIVASPTYMKQHYISHVAYTTNNVLAAMERVMQNVHPGIIDPNDNIGLGTYPMTTGDQAALGDPLEDLWLQGSTPLSATSSGTPTTGNAPLSVSFTGSATGGTGPYAYSWNFGDGSATSTLQNPSHTYNSACACTATLTVTDSSVPVKTATSNVTVTVSAVGNPLAATASATPTSGQVPLNVAFSGTATGGAPPYGYNWNFGDGSAASTLQNPSHTYNAAATYTAALTVTDSSAPVKMATSNVTITASPIAGAPPGAPTGVTASAGNAQVALSWAAPASNGGVSITSYKVYRSTTTGTETLLTAGGCSGLGAVLSCTDTGLTNGQAYFYKVSAVNAIGEGVPSNEARATPVAVANPLSQNFDGGSAIPTGWTATGLWRVGANCLGAASTPNSLQFNSASACNYNPLRSSGFATSPAFDISAATTPTLTFNTKYQVESYSGHTDQMTVQAKTATGAWTTLWTRDSTNPAQTTFAPVTLDLSAFKSAGSQVRFSFDSMDAFPRSFPGWAVDDVAVGAGVATVPGAPTGLVATAGNAQVSLRWAAPASNGGSAITSYKVYRGTTAGTETLLTAGGCSGVTAFSCTDTGLANGQAYFYKVAAANAVGTGAQSVEVSATPTVPTGGQLLGNPGFETGTAAPWTAASGVIASNSAEPPHSGIWDAWLDGYGTTHTDTLAQTVTIPAATTSATLNFWLHIDTAETTTTTAYDTLSLQILNSSGGVLATLHSWSNVNAATGYTQQSFDVSAYKGQSITIKYTGTEDASLQTSFVIDDTALNTQ
jgi:PKD repeat protein